MNSFTDLSDSLYAVYCDTELELASINPYTLSETNLFPAPTKIPFQTINEDKLPVSLGIGTVAISWLEWLRARKNRNIV